MGKEKKKKKQKIVAKTKSWGLRRKELDEERVELFNTNKIIEEWEKLHEEKEELEGQIVLDDGRRTGLLALLKIIENINVSQDHDANVESIDFEGKFKVENPSKKDRLWDIDLILKNIEDTNLNEKEIKIRELGTDKDTNVYSKKFKLVREAKNLLLVKEYINSLPGAESILNQSNIERDLRRIEREKIKEVDEENFSSTEVNLESFIIPIERKTTIYFAIAIKNLFKTPIKKIELTKELPDDFLSPNLIDTSAGNADVQEGEIIWKIEENIQPDSFIILKFSAEIYSETIDKISTGPISVKYEGKSSYSRGY